MPLTVIDVEIRPMMNPADLKRKAADNSTDDVVVAALEEEQAQKKSKKAQQGPKGTGAQPADVLIMQRVEQGLPGQGSLQAAPSGGHCGTSGCS